jgi:hypothetical protein
MTRIHAPYNLISGDRAECADHRLGASNKSILMPKPIPFGQAQLEMASRLSALLGSTNANGQRIHT